MSQLIVCHCAVCLNSSWNTNSKYDDYFAVDASYDNVITSTVTITDVLLVDWNEGAYFVKRSSWYHWSASVCCVWRVLVRLPTEVRVKDACFDCKWTDAEDASLLRGVYKYGIGNWDAIRMDAELELSEVSEMCLSVACE